MALNIMHTSTLLIIFTAILWIISLFLRYQTINSPKVARPFLLSLTVYFFLMSMCNLAQAIAFLSDLYPAGQDSVYNNYLSLLFIYGAPIYLISQVETNFFKDKELLSRYHIFSLTSLVLFIIFVVISLISGIAETSLFESFSMVDYWYILYPLWFMNNLIIVFAFFYLGVKTSENYRLYSFLISIGWTLNQIFNISLQIPWLERTTLLLTVVFVMKYAGAIITAIFLYLLYNLKEL
ncbi:MAG: hypothetical protein ACOC44_05680 [Promethearchaeia archaeon]